MKKDLTQGSVTKTMLLFAGPMILGNLLQQCYNIADTLIVGRFLGADALAAVGSAYTLMTFLTSILIGLCMGSGAVFSVYFGRKDPGGMRRSMCASFFFIAAVSLLMNGAVFAGIHLILGLLQVPQAVYHLMYDYVWVIFFGIFFVFLYNYFAFLLRAVGNSLIPLCFLGGAAFLNIVLDLVFVISFSWGVRGAALATVIAQAVSGIGIGVYAWFGMPELRPKRDEIRLAGQNAPEILRHSFAACVQQSVMNFGILMVQGLVNSFGPVVMAAFAAAVKIDSFAYMPVQDFGNAFSTFVAQNCGAGEQERIRKGIRSAWICTLVFCLIISTGVCLFARELLLIFVRPSETEVLAVGVEYLRIEGTFYCLIGFLFLFYGYFRAMGKPGISVVLTVISLGTRVVLAYSLSAVPWIGVKGIWAAVPVGWFLADLAGFLAAKSGSKIRQ